MKLFEKMRSGEGSDPLAALGILEKPVANCLIAHKETR
jgi:hypothetical protein